MSKKQNNIQSQEEKRQHQNMLLQKKKMIAQSDRHLKQITKLTYEMDQVTDNTAVQLHGQTEKLNRIQNIGKDISKQIKKADKHSKQMTSFWYYLKQRVKGLILKETPQENSQKGPVIHEKTQKKITDYTNSKKDQFGNNISSYQNQQALGQVNEDNYQQKQNQQLDQISRQLQKLKLKAKGIGNELDTQTEIIGRIDKKMDENSAKIQKVDKRLKKNFFE